MSEHGEAAYVFVGLKVPEHVKEEGRKYEGMMSEGHQMLTSM